MPRHSTFPTLYDDALQLSITKLSEWGYINNGLKNGNVTWSRNGYETASISIVANFKSENPYINLSYKYGDESRNYSIRFVPVPSNLGKGVIWFFLCPQTGKRCRKLYSIGGYFLHREAFTGCMYESQTQSKYYRFLDSTLGLYYKSERLYTELYKKHFKKTYAGRPTKRYLRIMNKIRQAEGISELDIKKLIS